MSRSRPILLLVALMMLAAACGSGNVSGGDSATPVDGLPLVDLEVSREFVLASAERTETLPYRFEASLTMLMDLGFVRMEIDGDEPMLRGTFDGSRTEMTADLGVMLSELADSNPMFADAFAELDTYRDLLVLEAVIDADTIYLHAPLFGVPGFEMPGATDLGALADGWGRIELSRLAGFGFGDVASLSGAGGMDPTEVLVLLDQLGVNVRDEGQESVRGVPTTRLVAPILLADLLSAQGDPFEMLGDFTDPSMLEQLDAVADAHLDLTVNVDGQGLIRRVAYEIDFSEAFGGIDDPTGMFADVEMRFGFSVDLFDHGHQAAVAIPPGATDVTALFAGLGGWSN